MFETAKENKTDTSYSNAQKSSATFFNPLIQPKLTINNPDDEYEKEADAMADKVMRMTDNESLQQPFFKPAISSLQRKCAACEEEEKEHLQMKSTDNFIQRQETPTETPPTQTPATGIEIPHLELSTSSLFQPSTGPDFLGMRQPFFNRNIPHLWDPDSAIRVWQFNFDFFRRVGLSPDLSTTLTNFTAPRFIDSQLKAGNPTWWEITDRELNTTTFSASIPVLEFTPNFSPVAPSWLKTIFGGGGSSVQRKCAACAEEEKMQRKESTGENYLPSFQTENYIDSLKGKGTPLTVNEKSFFEPKFGYDFSNVRIHNDERAGESARNISALAYTQGNNIVFASNQYKPETAEGKQLLAHELTHVVQQNAGINTKKVQRTIARQVACAPGPFTSNGGTVIADPVAFITEAETRAAALIDAAVDELTFTRDRIVAGAEPGWPTIGDSLGFALTLMGLNPDSRNTWTRSGVGSVNLLIRRLRAIRSTLTGTGVFYLCDPQGNITMTPCSPATCRGEGADAFSCAGAFKILLCDSFWAQGSLDERAVMLMHEHAHNFAAFIQDSGREGNAECYARFVIEANGLTSSAQSAGLCPNP